MVSEVALSMPLIAAGSIMVLNFKSRFGAILKTMTGIVDCEFRPRSNIARSLC
jgi:hypothetical protein